VDAFWSQEPISEEKNAKEAYVQFLGGIMEGTYV
jgi:hypothetical protein